MTRFGFYPCCWVNSVWKLCGPWVLNKLPEQTHPSTGRIIVADFLGIQDTSASKVTEGEIVSMIGQDAGIWPYMSPFLSISTWCNPELGPRLAGPFGVLNRFLIGLVQSNTILRPVVSVCFYQLTVHSFSGQSLDIIGSKPSKLSAQVLANRLHFKSLFCSGQKCPFLSLLEASSPSFSRDSGCDVTWWSLLVPTSL